MKCWLSIRLFSPQKVITLARGGVSPPWPLIILFYQVLMLFCSLILIFIFFVDMLTDMTTKGMFPICLIRRYLCKIAMIYLSDPSDTLIDLDFCSVNYGAWSDEYHVLHINKLLPIWLLITYRALAQNNYFMPLLWVSVLFPTM